MQTDPDQPVIDLTAALARLGGNREILEDLAMMFRDDAPELLKELKAAASSDNSEQAGRAAHRLKGLVSTFNAVRAGETARAVEQAARQEDMARVSALLPELEAELQLVVNRLQDELADRH